MYIAGHASIHPGCYLVNYGSTPQPKSLILQSDAQNSIPSSHQKLHGREGLHSRFALSPDDELNKRSRVFIPFIPASFFFVRPIHKFTCCPWEGLVCDLLSIPDSPKAKIHLSSCPARFGCHPPGTEIAWACCFRGCRITYL